MEKVNRKIHTAYNGLQLMLLPGLMPFFLTYALLRKKYRYTFPKRLGIGLPQPLEKKDGTIWIHTLSLGEFHSATHLISQVKKAFSEKHLVLSASTSSGLKAIKNSPLSKDATVIPLCYDIGPVVKRFVNFYRPQLFILVETDLWPNLLWSLKKNATKIILANGAISSRAANRLKQFPHLTRYLYDPFDYVCMQSNDDVQRLKSAGGRGNIRNFGNMKFDVSPKILSQEEKKRLLAEVGMKNTHTIFIAGSTHHPEEEIIISIYSEIRKKIPNLKLIIAPRNVNRRNDIKKICDSYNMPASLRSQGRPKAEPDVFILDTLGELTKFYNLCQVAFVGGSLAPIGGHNILEPVALGKPVIFGPFVESIKEIAQSVEEKGGGFMASDPSQLKVHLLELFLNGSKRAEAATKGLSLINENKGAVARYMKLIPDLLD